MSGPVLQAERAFRAMGSDAHVLVWCGADCAVGAEDLLDAAESQVEWLEARWSRFRDTSDIGRLNRAGGRAVPIATETADLLDLCVDAAAHTAGRFDPLVLPDLIAAGYDRSFDELANEAPGHRRSRRAARRSRRRPDAEGREPVSHRPVGPPAVRRDLTVDRIAGTATLAAGAAIDVGGIGKGRAADLVAAALVGLGAEAACVNLGGDLRTTGPVPGPDALVVAIADPFGGDDLARWSVRDAAVATSSCLRRRWVRDGEDRHHLIDPATGRPARTDVVACSVIAPTGAWADVLAKAVLLAPDDADELLGPLGAAALVVHAGGRVTTIGTPPSIAGIGAPEAA